MSLALTSYAGNTRMGRAYLGSKPEVLGSRLLVEWDFEDTGVGQVTYASHNSGNGSVAGTVDSAVNADPCTLSATSASDEASLGGGSSSAFRDRSDTIWTGKTRDQCLQFPTRGTSVMTETIDTDRYVQFGLTANGGEGLYLDELTFLASGNGTGTGTDPVSGYGEVTYGPKRFRIFVSFDGFTTSSELAYGGALYGQQAATNTNEATARKVFSLKDNRFSGCSSVQFRIYPYKAGMPQGGRMRLDDIRITGTTGLLRTVGINDHLQSKYTATPLTTSGCSDSTVGLIMNDSNTSLPAGRTNEDGNVNYNGPSLIRIPSWVDPADRADPSAVYYLYYGHHNGHYIRMAWAANLAGPWTAYRPDDGDSAIIASDTRTSTDGRGVIDLGPTGFTDRYLLNGWRIENDAANGHVSSPNVIIDDVNQRFVMIMHAAGNKVLNVTPAFGPIGQMAVVATSTDGLNFHPDDKGGEVGEGLRRVAPIGLFYLNPFQVRGQWYGFANYGTLWRYQGSDPWNLTGGTEGGTDPLLVNVHWQQVSNEVLQKHFWPAGANVQANGWQGGTLDDISPRHTQARSIHPNDDIIEIWTTLKYETPEAIYRIEMVTQSDDPADWFIRNDYGETYLPVTEAWEGFGNAQVRGENGAAAAGEPNRRDPTPFVDDDDRVYLLYTGGGEDGIGIAELLLN